MVAIDAIWAWDLSLSAHPTPIITYAGLWRERYAVKLAPTLQKLGRFGGLH